MAGSVLEDETSAHRQVGAPQILVLGSCVACNLEVIFDAEARKTRSVVTVVFAKG